MRTATTAPDLVSLEGAFWKLHDTTPEALTDLSEVKALALDTDDEFHHVQAFYGYTDALVPGTRVWYVHETCDGDCTWHLRLSAKGTDPLATDWNQRLVTYTRHGAAEATELHLSAQNAKDAQG